MSKIRATKNPALKRLAAQMKALGVESCVYLADGSYRIELRDVKLVRCVENGADGSEPQRGEIAYEPEEEVVHGAGEERV